jgi:hypothetical protein
MELYRFGGLSRLSWTEFQALPQPVLDYYLAIEEAAQHVRAVREHRDPGAARPSEG